MDHRTPHALKSKAQSNPDEAYPLKLKHWRFRVHFHLSAGSLADSVYVNCSVGRNETNVACLGR